MKESQNSLPWQSFKSVSTTLLFAKYKASRGSISSILGTADEEVLKIKSPENKEKK